MIFSYVQCHASSPQQGTSSSTLWFHNKSHSSDISFFLSDRGMSHCLAKYAHGQSSTGLLPEINVGCSINCPWETK